jgi:hypothetical protein
MMLNRTQRRLLRPQGLESSVHTSGKFTEPEPEPEPEGRRLPHWAIYTIAISGGVVVLVAVAAATTYLFFSRRKKDTTVMPWSTGLSGPIRKAFVAGQLTDSEAFLLLLLLFKKKTLEIAKLLYLLWS